MIIVVKFESKNIKATMNICGDICKYSFINISRVLYEIFWNFVSDINSIGLVKFET